MKCLTLRSGKSTQEIHLLNVKDCFPNFGGSRHALVVQKTASIVIRTRNEAGELIDTEHKIDDPKVWNAIAKCINTNDGSVTANSFDDDKAKYG